MTSPKSIGHPIQMNKNGSIKVPSDPIIPFIEGDGIGRDITRAAQIVLNAAVEKAYRGKKRIAWKEIYAGEKAFQKTGSWLPDETFRDIKKYKVALKGPLTTPIGGGFRSLNVALRRRLDLYACVRPCKFYGGIETPVKHPEYMNIIIFRENTEDVYAGYEYKKGSKEALKLIKFLDDSYGIKIRKDSGIGIKPISKTATQKLVRKAIQHAIQHKCPSVTLVHKGNIMKFTEGAFRDWGYEIAKKEFSGKTITEDELWKKYKGKAPKGKVIIKDRIADSIFQQILTRTREYSVLATPNLNGDYISDACAAQIGGLGMAPGANIGDKAALFEATHGTAPKYTDKDVINPSSLILSGEMMFRHLGWDKAADLVIQGIINTIKKKTVTYDLHRLMKNAKKMKCSEYAKAICKNM